MALSSSDAPFRLKRATLSYSIFGRSDQLIPTSLSHGFDPRAYYLSASQVHANLTPAPLISSSLFVPPSLIEHLMRNKKSRAIGVKFVSGNHPPDEVTNMEGALHTYVTPIVPTLVHGEYAYQHGQHMMLRFPPDSRRCDQARKVVVSALIQPDFEDEQVMLALSALTQQPSVGKPLHKSFRIPSAREKQDPAIRAAYDDTLRGHMIYHLVSSHQLPAVSQVQHQALSVDAATDMLEQWIRDPQSTPQMLCRTFFRVSSRHILSLELLFNSAIQQMRNELSALEGVCPQGYVYTFDPPAIFARKVDATLLNRLVIAALKLLSQNNIFRDMRSFAFNDYADPAAVATYLPLALQQQKHVLIMRKRDLLFSPNSIYTPPPIGKGALLVLHNNSDAFGQNIETEYPGGSMDGCIGGFSSTAASLRRDRRDLLDYLM